MKKERFLVLIIAVLLVTNLSVLMYFTNKKGQDLPGEKKKQRTLAYLKDELAFSKQQLSSYDSLYQIQYEELNAKMELLREAKKNAITKIIPLGFSDSAIRATSSVLANAAQPVEALNLQHLRSIRQLCTETQAAKFDSTFYKMFRKRKPKKD